MDHVVTQRWTVTVNQYEDKPTEDGQGTMSVKVGEKTEYVDVIVNFLELARALGRKACQSKGRKAKCLGGAVMVKAEKRIVVHPAGTRRRRRRKED